MRNWLTSGALALTILVACKEDEPSRGLSKDKEREINAKLTLSRLEYVAYPRWAASHPDQACPASLQELKEGSSAVGTDEDPWGTPYHFECLPAGGIMASSAGPDRKLDTPDDIIR